jgi:MerR family redox-sensitive transcriptional activator SoxR
MVGEQSGAAPSAGLTIGEVTARSGLSNSAVHFYERKGLIRGWRSRGNQRRYARDVLRRLAVIKVGQRVGIPLAVIGDALDRLPQDRSPSVADWAACSSSWEAELTARILGLIALRDQLSQCIGCGCLSLNSCPLFNPCDKAGAEGPGPRFIAVSPPAYGADDTLDGSVPR